MLESLEGIVAGADARSFTLKTGPAVFFLHAPGSTTSRLKKGSRVTVFTHLLVREDDLRVYGFLTEEERELFRMLIGVQSVGPAAAASLLSAAPPARLRAAIARGERDILTSVKGIASKTAARIVLELKGKIGAAPAPAGEETAATQDAAAALAAFGHTPAEAREAVRKALEAAGVSASAEDLVREALKKV